jgi:hypothetical protein
VVEHGGGPGNTGTLKIEGGDYMCDYSLMGVPNRLAREGEDLVVYEFPTGTRGLTKGTSVTNTDTAQPECKSFRSFAKWLFGQLESKPKRVAVCIPPGARLLLSDIQENMQHSLAVGATEEVTFTQLTARPYRYRDALRFTNGREILLQQLKEGQRVRVLQLSLVEESVQSVWKTADVFRY